jgi:RNA polymerase sigma factor (sigma-70 family)
MPVKRLIEPLAACAYSEGREKFGDLGLELDAFAERISAIVRKNLGASATAEATRCFVRDLHGQDLYLATACAQSSPGSISQNSFRQSADNSSAAWKMLETTYRGLISDLVRYFYRSSFAAQDLADSVLADLFLPDRSGRGRIASYDGRSSLSTWLRVVVCNRVINAHRCSASAKSSPLEPELPDGSALARIDATVRARRYGPALKDSMASACSTLTPRERLMLLWRYEDGLQLGQIARLLGIHQSNVTRQLERIQSKLRDDVASILSDKHGLSRSAVQECLQDIVENPRHQISVLEFVKTGDPHSSSYLSPAAVPGQVSTFKPAVVGPRLVKQA